MTFLESISSLNTWITEHKELVTVIGIPLLTWLVTTITAKSAERRSAAERRAATQEAAKDRAEERNLRRALKISEYRRAWIESLRKEFVEVLLVANASRNRKAELVVEFDKRFQMITLMVNLNDEDLEPIFQEMYNLIGAIKSDQNYNPTDLSTMMQLFLKKEWEKLKSEIEEATVK